jgi:EmrB/QacA subfamily drug resistance transporter
MTGLENAVRDVGTARGSNKWKVLAALVLGLTMVVLDATVVNVALRTMQREFGASVSDVQWIVSVYVMALGIATPVSAFLADRIGGKRVFLVAIGTFGLGSLLCGISPNLGSLVAARALQGIGGGLAVSVGIALLYAAFSEGERGKAFGVFAVALVVAPALGPIFGGWLADAGRWRWIFFFNVPIAAAGVLLGSRWLQDTESTRKLRLDRVGLIASTIGFGAVLYAASVEANFGWSSSQVLTALGVGGAALLFFAVWELLVAADPLLDLRLFREPVFSLGTVIGWVSVVALFGAEFLLPLYLQVLRGKTALEAGVILLPLAAASAVAAPVAGLLYDRLGPRLISVVGFGLLAVNAWQLSQLNMSTSVAWVEVLLVIRGLAVGLTIQTTLTVALSVVPPRQTTQASATINATRNVVQSLGVAVLATVLASAISSVPGGPYSPAFAAHYVSGLGDAYRLTLWASLVAAALAIALPGWPLRWPTAAKTAQDNSATPPASAA